MDVLKLVLDLYGRQLGHSEAQPRDRETFLKHSTIG